MRRLLCARLALAALPFSLLGACDAAEPEFPRPRLVVLLATCTLRRDVLGPYDPAVDYTPRLDELAAESVVFRRHETESGQSGTDFAALFTGSQAHEHGVYSHPRALRPELELIGEVYARAGYETWFFNGHRMAAIDLGYGQGVPPERSIDIRGERKRRLLAVQGDAFGKILAGLGAHPERQAFVLVNFTVTHGPYPKQVSREEVLDFVQRFPAHGRGVTAAELERWWPVYLEHRLELEWDLPATRLRLGLDEPQLAELARVLEVTYRSAVHQLDRLVGEVVDEIRAAGLWDDTLFAFTADHGETLYRPETPFHWNHGLQLAPEILGVPWLLHGPRQGLTPGVVGEVTRSIDVLPTLATLSGVARTAAIDGLDLAPALRGRAPFPALLAFSHTTTVNSHNLETFRELGNVLSFYPRTDPELCWVRVRQGDRVLKLLPAGEEGWRCQVFDLDRDPLETRDLYDPADPAQAELRAAAEAYRTQLVAGYARWNGAGEAAAEGDLDRLRELGYAR